MSVLDAIASALMILGALLVLLAGVGLVRMPDLYTRMSATSKASTLGVGLLVLGAALGFRTEPILVRALGLIAFLMLTAPVAAHRIGRVGYLSGVRPWEGTHHDALRGAQLGGPGRSHASERGGA